jgi:hypothetical protein
MATRSIEPQRTGAALRRCKSQTFIAPHTSVATPVPAGKPTEWTAAPTVGGGSGVQSDPHSAERRRCHER